MLVMALILTVGTAWIEIRFARNIGPLWWIMEHGLGPISPALCNLVFSIGISTMLGKLFGVNGLVGFMAGVMSTGVTNMYYPNEHFVKSARRVISVAPNKVASAVHSTGKVYGDFKQPIADFSKMILVFLRIVTTPVRWLRAASVAYTKARV